MNDEIKIVRTELHKAIETSNSTHSKKVMELSEKLDILIVDYYKKSMSFSFQMSGRR